MCKSTVGNIVKPFKEDRIDSTAQNTRLKVLGDHDKRWLMREVATDPWFSDHKMLVEVAEAC